MTEFIKNTNCRSPFDRTHIVRYRHLRGNHHNNMNMINLNIQFKNITALLLRKGSHAILYHLRNFARQNLETVFGHPHNMILAMP